MPQVLALFLGVLLMAGVVGCGGSGDKGTNKDLDRPKPAEKK